MRKLDKEDVYYAIDALRMHIRNMTEDEFDRFNRGIPLRTAMLPPRLQLDPVDPTVFSSSITTLDFRIS